MDRRDFLKLATTAAVAPGVWATESQPVLGAKRRADVVFKLPHSAKHRIAWTVDDGCEPRAIRRYIDHVEQHNVRLTFFVYSGMSGWRENQRRMQPFIDSGQIQIANHTHNHPDLRHLNARQIRRELLDCHHFLEDTYGVDARPYFRPPYGAYNARVREVAAELGYTKLMMWSGTLADSGHISLAREMYFGRRYMRDGSVLLGHANNMNADKLFDRLHAVVASRGLEMVTLADAMGPTFNPQPTPSETPIIVSPSASPSSPI